MPKCPLKTETSRTVRFGMSSTITTVGLRRGEIFRYRLFIDPLRKNLNFYRLLFNRICKIYQNSIAIEANNPNAAATYWFSS